MKKERGETRSAELQEGRKEGRKTVYRSMAREDRIA